MARRIDLSKLAPDVLLSDVERDAAVHILREHMGAGRITLDDFESRVAGVYEASTGADLQAPLRGVPTEPPAATSDGDVEPRLSRRARLRWRLQQEMTWFVAPNAVAAGIWAIADTNVLLPAAVVVATGVGSVRRALRVPPEPRLTRTRLRTRRIEIEGIRTRGPIEGPRVLRVSMRRARESQQYEPEETLHLAGEIEFDDVSFVYPGTSRYALDGVSFHVAPGEVAAIVGGTGSGKSTLVQLLARQYDPTTGRILIDGTNLRELPQTAYRRRLGIVMDDDFLFSGTVASNLGIGDDDASRRRMWEALEATGVSRTLEARGGLDAVVQEQGRNFTRSERQLIALSRALVRRPDIAVLDDATARLDAQTATQAISAFAALGRTTLIVTSDERLATVSAHQVNVLDQGRTLY